MPFSKRQLARLSRAPDDRVLYKRNSAGKELLHLPGWYLLEQANAIFGHAGWDRATIQLEKLFERHALTSSFTFMAKVRVTVRTLESVIIREGMGVGHGDGPNPGLAMEKAIKTAETDATKRALVTFGTGFGLDLYRSSRYPSPRLVLLEPTKGGGALLEPQAFTTSMRRLIMAANQAREIKDLLAANKASIEALRGLSTDGRRRYKDYADSLVALAAARVQKIEEGAQDSSRSGATGADRALGVADTVSASQSAGCGPHKHNANNAGGTGALGPQGYGQRELGRKFPGETSRAPHIGNAHDPFQGDQGTRPINR